MTSAAREGDRFEILAPLGRGGMGWVHRAIDRQTGAEVALKTVGHVQGDALLRFKREFRALRDLGHPHLVQLGELFEENGNWSYTMELLEGEDFLTYVRGGVGLRESDASEVKSVAPDTIPDLAATLAAGPRLATNAGAPPPPRFSERRLRSALTQLAVGLEALHAAGKVHRDIKPANLLVTHDERLVILDLGLVTELRDGIQATDVGIVGTVRYMAPEQAMGKPVDARADWYAVGAVIYEVITGRPPFDGAVLEVIVRKSTEDPASARDLTPDAPADLCDLCMRLLARNPDERPTESEILALLDAHRPRGDASTTSSSAIEHLSAEQGAHGRSNELRMLHAALERARTGTQVRILVQGESGIGKSMLLRRFEAELRRRAPDAWILRGECSQLESVPYQGIDGIIDGLSSELRATDLAPLQVLSEAHAQALVRAFPVLKRIGALATERSRPVDPRDSRSQLFGAIRALLAAVTAKRPLVLVLEDVQWLDPDSAALLRELAREPDAPPFLLVASEQVEPEAEEARDALPGLEPERLHVGPLAVDDASELVQFLLGRRGREVSREVARRMAEDAELHPMFIEAMVRATAAGKSWGTESSCSDLDGLLFSSVRDQGPSALALLQLVSLSPNGVPRSVIESATSLTSGPLTRLLSSLRLAHLVSLRGSDAHAVITAYHKRVALAVGARMEASERRMLQRRLAEAYEKTHWRDPMLLARLWEDAGELALAAKYAAQAAEEFALAFAPDRAAQLYQRSLALDPVDARSRRLALAHALANAGRGVAAAEAFAALAQEEGAGAAVDLRRRAAEQYLVSGHFEEGIRLFAVLLATVGVSYPKTAARALMRVLWLGLRRSMLRALGGYARKFHPSASTVRADVLASAAASLSPVDSVRAFPLIVGAHVEALKLGEPGRLARSMAYEASTMVVNRQRARARSDRLMQEAERLAAEASEPAAAGIVLYHRGLSNFLGFRFIGASAHFDDARRAIREGCLEVPSELRSLEVMDVVALYSSGRWRAARERVSALLHEAEEKSDRYIEAQLRSHVGTLAGCMEDEAEAACEAARGTLERYGARDVNALQSFCRALAQTGWYLGDPVKALREFEQHGERLANTLVLYAQLNRVMFLGIQGLAPAAAAPLLPGEASTLLRRARRSARRLAREDVPTATGLSLAIEGYVALSGGTSSEALARLERAATAFRATDDLPYAMVATRRWGELRGGAEGAAAIAACDEWMRAEGVARPDRMAAAILPDLPR